MGLSWDHQHYVSLCSFELVLNGSGWDILSHSEGWICFACVFIYNENIRLYGTFTAICLKHEGLKNEPMFEYFVLDLFCEMDS